LKLLGVLDTANPKFFSATGSHGIRLDHLSESPFFCHRFARHQVGSSLGKPMQIDLLSKFWNTKNGLRIQGAYVRDFSRDSTAK